MQCTDQFHALKLLALNDSSANNVRVIKVASFNLSENAKQHRRVQRAQISPLSTWWYRAHWPQCNTRCIITILRFTAQDIIKATAYFRLVKIQRFFLQYSLKWISNQMVFLSVCDVLMRITINAFHQQNDPCECEIHRHERKFLIEMIFV